MQAVEQALHDRCLYVDAGWWGYELCWARHLRQFHVPELDVEQKLESVHLLGASASIAGWKCGSISTGH
jgi:Glucosidase II beta subunit-like protein